MKALNHDMRLSDLGVVVGLSVDAVGKLFEGTLSGCVASETIVLMAVKVILRKAVSSQGYMEGVSVTTVILALEKLYSYRESDAKELLSLINVAPDFKTVIHETYFGHRPQPLPRVKGKIHFNQSSEVL